METNIKAANDAVVEFATAAAKKTMEAQTSLFKDWVALNKKLWVMNPAKDLFTAHKK